jgi:iron complex outermembrane receptor protein
MPSFHVPRPRLLVLALRTALLSTPLAVACGLPLAAYAQAVQGTHRFDIPAGPLSTALTRVAAQAGARLSADAALIAGKSAPELRGTMTLGAALDLLLAGSGLVASEEGATLLIKPLARPEAEPRTERVLPAITVLGSRDPSVPLSNAPASITVVPREEIVRQQPIAQRVEDILGRTVPGFNPTNVGVRQIRGRTAQVFINGVPSNASRCASRASSGASKARSAGASIRAGAWAATWHGCRAAAR